MDRIVAFLVALASCSSDAARSESDSNERSARSNEELAVAWWGWAAEEPDATNPVVDESGDDCARNQPNDVWFLAGNFGGTSVRSCEVPAGRELFYPVINAFCGPQDGCDTWYDDAERSATLNGKAVAIIEIDTLPAVLDIERRNSVTATPGSYAVVAAGWWVRLPPLDAGEHRIQFRGESDGFVVDVTYNLVAVGVWPFCAIVLHYLH